MELYNLKYPELVEYAKKIKYGYINKNNQIIYNSYTNPTNDYYLQSPQELLKNNIGLCYDIVELYRDYLVNKNIYCESYYIEYQDDNILEAHAFMIHRKKNKLWYECIDNSWETEIDAPGYTDKEKLLKNIYEWFQEYVSSIYPNVDKTKFYLNKYSYPKAVLSNKMSLQEYCKNKNYLKSSRDEYSGMAIVFCQDKVLVLETKHNEFVFPKGHIEDGETSKDASIRECLEESGVCLDKAKYYGKCGQYKYTFSGGHLKITNDNFNKIFGVNSITKTIYVHVYELSDFQDFKLETIFIKGLWIKISQINETISHENTKELFDKALEMYQKK